MTAIIIQIILIIVMLVFIFLLLHHCVTDSYAKTIIAADIPESLYFLNYNLKMESQKTITKIAIADDHVLFRTGIASIIKGFNSCSVMFEASNGDDVVRSVTSGLIPDIILLDLNMPDMDGFQTCEWLNKHHPEINILMVSMYDTELTMIRLLKLGVKGFLRKDMNASELNFAINSIIQCGYYYTNSTTSRLINLFRKNEEHAAMMRSTLSEVELSFLKHTCSDLTYKEIANNMNLNLRAVDNMRDNLFDKLGVKSRVGLAMYALRHCIKSF